MPKLPSKTLSKLAFADHTPSQCEGEVRLQTIIQTFRENNIKLLKRIEECDRMREGEQHSRRRKQSQPPGVQCQADLPRQHMTSTTKQRSIFKGDRRSEAAVKENATRENLAELKRKTAQRSQESQEPETPQEDHKLRLVKVKASRLIPLSIDRLKERLKML